MQAFVCASHGCWPRRENIQTSFVPGCLIEKQQPNGVNNKRQVYAVRFPFCFGGLFRMFEISTKQNVETKHYGSANIAYAYFIVSGRASQFSSAHESGSIYDFLSIGFLLGMVFFSSFFLSELILCENKRKLKSQPRCIRIV